MMIPLKTACQISNLTDRTIRDWVADGKVVGGKDDLSGILHVDKESLLKALPTSICLYNQKGGVGKTTISVMLADYFDKKGVKILLIDLDQQANLSQSYFDYEDIRGSSTLYNYLEDKTPLTKCIKSYNENIDVLPADIRLSRKDNYDLDELDSLRADFLPVFKKYQVIIIDCPPSLSAMSKFGLLLSNYVFIPVILSLCHRPAGREITGQRLIAACDAGFFIFLAHVADDFRLRFGGKRTPDSRVIFILQMNKIIFSRR